MNSSKTLNLTMPIMPTNESMINYLPAAPSCNSESAKPEVAEDKETVSSSEDEAPYSQGHRVRRMDGHWGPLTFEKGWWSNQKRPFVKLRVFEDLVLTENERNGILSDRMIAASLSHLDEAPEVNRYVLCKCVITNKDIMDLSALEKYHYIQYLNLSQNNLSTLVYLGQMPFLQYLDVSNNFIKNLLDFKAPFNLSYVDYSENCLTEIPDLSEFWSISHLNLSRNEIQKINGLENLKYLTYLDISGNLITKLENLNNMRIRFLILNHNVINSIEPRTPEKVFHTLSNISYVDLSYNKLKSLKCFDKSNNLETLNMSNNGIRNVLEVYYLRSLMYLTRLDLSDNPISADPHYHNICIREVKHLRYLDDEEITAEKKIAARTEEKIDPTLSSRVSRMELLLLQQINKPSIGAHAVPYDQPPPNLIVLVGPPGSRKKEITRMFVETNKRLILGVSHTTRPKIDRETDGREYHFVSNEEFVNLLRKGEFIATSEFNGYSFGIAHSELQRCDGSVMVFHSDIKTAMTLKVMGICPKLVLAMPRSENTHLLWLKQSYFFERLSDAKQARIKYCPQWIKSLTGPDDEDMPTNISDGNFDMNEVSMESTSTERRTLSSQTEQYLAERNIFRGSSITPSLSSDQFEFDEFKEKNTTKSHTGILKTKPPPPKMKGVRSVSFTENTASLVDKFGSKRVSVNWSPSSEKMEEGCYKVDSKDAEKSISDSCVFMSMSYKYMDHIVLSALSSSNIVKESTEEQETVYMSPSQRFELVQMEKLGWFFEGIIGSRQEYLELHLENPGLFRSVIFTDDEIDCVKQLKELLKSVVESHASLTYSYEDDPVFKRMLESKIEKLKLKENIFVRKSNDKMDISLGDHN